MTKTGSCRIQFSPAQTGYGGGFAPIVNGKYDTAADGRGHLGGEHTVQIVGFDGLMNPADPLSPAKPMFAAYRQTMKLPIKTSKMDFEVPSDAGK